MVEIKSSKEIEYMQEGGKILAQIMERLKYFSKPGINTLEIDNLAETLMKRFNVLPSFKNFRGYKYASCLSVNEEVVHGIPGRHTLKDGDIFTIDLGVYHKGLHTDSAKTFAIGKISNKAKKLIKITSESLNQTIKLIKPGVKLGTLSANIAKIIKENGFGVIKELSGHGIGKNLQEEPRVLNYAKTNTGLVLKPGMTFCLEPMVAIGHGNIKTLDDGWTISSIDNSLTAHFEHTVAVTKNKYLILTKE